MTKYLIYRGYMNGTTKKYVPLENILDENITIELNTRPLIGERIFVEDKYQRIVEVLHVENLDTILVV
jgi:hypothetical protein